MKKQNTSLMSFICQAIDEVLPEGSPTNGREIYLRGFEAFQEYHFARMRKESAHRLAAAIPLLEDADA